MKKLIIGFVIGALIGFPLGINFGRDAPLFSNPFVSKPDMPERVKERAEEALRGAKDAIHEATKPEK
jgi:hypothetical protein